MKNQRVTTKEYKRFNHYHKITKEQQFVNFGTGTFIADKKRIPLLKALNECGLITRTHCFGHEIGYSFVSILLDENMTVEFKIINDGYDDKRFPKGTPELLISWKRKEA